jgi:hypothetical protein
VLPASVFDDNDWPGATPAARRSTAGDWLNEQGIAVVTTT